MLLFYLLYLISRFEYVLTYSHKLFALSIPTTTPIDNMQCAYRSAYDYVPFDKLDRLNKEKGRNINASFAHRDEKDPFLDLQKIIHRYLFGSKVDAEEVEKKRKGDPNAIQKLKTSDDADKLTQYPSGNLMRAELFFGKRSVHFPHLESLHRGHCRLKVTKDHMQTAVNAYAILLGGNLQDAMNLPSDYVLKSARTISMMKIAYEKYASMWSVVKGDTKPGDMPYWTLEVFRPLFKYLNGREMARLNLSDNRILTYIGTHAELNRHQVGVVASRYMRLNPDWPQAKFLNLMNNLLCGVPMSFMRRINSNIYLQLSHQVFYHIRACDPLQRRFYLAMMTRTEALGKSYSWSARDVSRLGLLLAEVEGAELAAIKPESMSGITAQVMLAIPSHNLQYITEVQLRYLGLKPLNILARKLKNYQDQLKTLSSGFKVIPTFAPCCILLIYLVGVLLDDTGSK